MSEGTKKHFFFSQLLLDLKSSLAERSVSLLSREKEVSDLKSLVARLTKNNQEMLSLLTGHVGQEESLRRQLDEEKRKGEKMGEKVRKEEGEVVRLRNIIRLVNT
jgi:hypothetical protein